MRECFINAVPAFVRQPTLTWPDFPKATLYQRARGKLFAIWREARFWLGMLALYFIQAMAYGIAFISLIHLVKG